MTALRPIWQPQRRIEGNYFNALLQVMDFLDRMGWNGADPYDLTKRLRALASAPFWVRYAEEAARQMVTMLFIDGARDWRDAARLSGRGREIYAALREELAGPVGGAVSFQVRRNAEMIGTLPLDIARRVTDYIQEETLKGRRSEDLEDELRAMFPKATRTKAQLIARTEVSKTQTALTRARAEEIGARWYLWETSRDARVRDSHRHMQGVLVNWDDPPSPERLIHMRKPPAPYHAGDIWNCRCYPAPLLRLESVDWPHKVYHQGRIRSMTRAEFERLAA